MDYGLSVHIRILFSLNKNADALRYGHRGADCAGPGKGRPAARTAPAERSGAECGRALGSTGPREEGGRARKNSVQGQAGGWYPHTHLEADIDFCRNGPSWSEAVHTAQQ